MLSLVHSDVCGKMSTKSLGGAEYFVTFIDDKSRMVWVYPIKTKDQVFQKFTEWKALVENATGERVKTLRTDNGGEYTGKKFEQYLIDCGIKHEYTVPKTPEQNGVAERMNRTIVEMARAMLCESKLPRRFWGEAVSTAAYLRNRSPTVAVKGMTPYECLHGEKPEVGHLRVFGCVAYAHIPKDERVKFGSKARKCVFLGYGEAVKAYRLYDMDRGRVIHSRDVIFNEKEVTMQVEPPVQTQKEPMMQVKAPIQAQKEPVMEVKPPTQTQKEPAPVVEEPDVPGYIEDGDPEPCEDEPMAEPAGRPVRERKAPERFGEWVYLSRCSAEPTSVSEALSGPNSDKWTSAMNEEMDSLHEHNVWDYCELPEGRKAIGSKWVFKEKIGSDGTTERYKARLVAQGYSQRQGLDYDETFSPVARAESVRTIMALAAKHNMVVHQMDVKTAFLNGKLEEEVYMRQPEGFIKEGQEHLVCRLKKAIYGLKQASRCWNATLHDGLCDIGFTQSTNDPCVYTSVGPKGLVIIAVHVDDLIIAGETEQSVQSIKSSIGDRYTVKDLGKLEYVLAISVNQHADGIWIGQPGYTKKVLERFNMMDCKPVSTPADSSTKLMKAGEDDELCDRELYQSEVGSLLYLSVWTRPDIAFAVGNAAKFCAEPTKTHWTAVKRIMRYLKGTMDLGLQYVRDCEESCEGYSDADWAGDTNDRKSTSGYIFQTAGAPISWRSRRQNCVALSTAEAEYIALANAAQEAVWLQRLLDDLHDNSEKPMVIHEDNQAAISMSKNQQYHGRAKHIDIKYHYIRELVADKCVVLKYCPTDSMIADILTKGLSKEKFIKIRDLSGMGKCPM